MKKAKTYTATIYCGLREEYSQRVHKESEVERIVQDYCNRIGLCITLAPTKFVYTNGNEPGVMIGLINYPRFPSTPQKIRKQAMNLAAILKEKLKQRRMSIAFPDKTIMLE